MRRLQYTQLVSHIGLPLYTMSQVEAPVGSGAAAAAPAPEPDVVIPTTADRLRTLRSGVLAAKVEIVRRLHAAMKASAPTQEDTALMQMYVELKSAKPSMTLHEFSDSWPAPLTLGAVLMITDTLVDLLELK
jgi:hypothetical protein